MGSTEDRSEEAIARLIAGIVQGCVHQLPGYTGAAALREDLTQEGQRAAWEAQARYRDDHPSGARWSTYMSYHIHGAIRDYLHEHIKAIRVPRPRYTAQEQWQRHEMQSVRSWWLGAYGVEPTPHDLERHFQSICAFLTRQLGELDHWRWREITRFQAWWHQQYQVEPTPEEIARHFDITRETLARLTAREQRHTVRCVSVESYTLPPDARTPEDAYRDQEQQRRCQQCLGVVQSCIAALPERQRTLFVSRVRDGMSLRAVGKAVGLTHEVVRRQVLRARAQVRRCCAQAGWQPEEVQDLLDLP